MKKSSLQFNISTFILALDLDDTRPAKKRTLPLIWRHWAQLLWIQSFTKQIQCEDFIMTTRSDENHNHTKPFHCNTNGEHHNLWICLKPILKLYNMVTSIICRCSASLQS